MGLAVFFFAATVAVSGPSGEPVEGSQIRCKPAPYYVAEKSDRQRVRKTVLTGSRVPVRRSYNERRARPCHLMVAPVVPHGFGPLKVAE